MEDRIVRWSKAALKQFEEAIIFIAKDSVQNALKVEMDILSKIKSLSRNPEIYSLDKFKTDNDGNYRAFELHKYRVSYKITSRIILIVRIRHTSRLPKLY